MRHGREWWSGHVGAWRSSGLSQAEYCRRHGVVQGSLARWATKLKSDGGRDLIEVGPSLGSAGSGSSLPQYMARPPIVPITLVLKEPGEKGHLPHQVQPQL